MKFSVIVCTYQTPEKELMFTLNSIVQQTIDEYEIIICDDGSGNNNYDFLVNYFKINNFTNYTLVLNKENRGTVKNLLSGINIAKGFYVKPIGGGDSFNDNDALQDVYVNMVKNDCKCLFTNMVVFSENIANEYKYYDNISFPRNKAIFLNAENIDKIKENILVFGDHISGASLFYNTQYVKVLLNLIEDTVIYMEDLVQYLVLLQKDEIVYLDKKHIMYKIGDGISTSRSIENNLKMSRDKKNFLEYIFNIYSEDEYVNRRKRIENINNKYNCKLLKGINKTIIDPKWLLYRVREIIDKN